MSISIDQLEQCASRWLICAHCHYVYPDSTTGHNCPHCPQPLLSPTRYFEHSVSRLIHLLIDAYQSKINAEQASDLTESSDLDYPISMAHYFSSLNTLLAVHLAKQLGRYNNLPEGQLAALIERLHRTHNGYPMIWRAITTSGWEVTATAVGSKTGIDHLALQTQIAYLTDLELNFRYYGCGWTISKNDALLCLNTLEPLTLFHVSLHNHYICDLFTGRKL